MDIKRLSRIVTTSGIVFYTIDIILSIILYTLLTIAPLLPVSGFGGRYTLNALVISVPLISSVFDGLILAMIIMSLKYAEYYGIVKSAIAIVIYIIIYSAISIYSGILFTFRARPVIDALMFALMALCVLQIIVLYFYARLQREMFG